MKGVNFDQQLSELKEKHFQDTIKQQRKHQEELNRIHTEKMIYKAKYEKLLIEIKNKCVVLFCIFFIVGVIGAYKLIVFLG